ncbi:hypothetical protein BBP40_009737, partial [Aspergillus hancockii]
EALRRAEGLSVHSEGESALAHLLKRTKFGNLQAPLDTRGSNDFKDDHTDKFDSMQHAGVAGLEASMTADLDTAYYESTDIFTPTAGSLQQYEQHQKILDILNYQRDNHEKLFSNSGNWLLLPAYSKFVPIPSNQVIVHGEKAVVWTQFPAEQIYVSTVLREANIDAEVFYAGHNRDEMMELIDRFIQKTDECRVLVCRYNVNTAGLNLQSRCRNVDLLSVGLSKSVVRQAIGRTSRLGQDRITFVYEYRAAWSSDKELANKSEEKAFPEIVAEVSEDFNVNSISEDEGDIDGRWVLRYGELYLLPTR